MKKTGRLVVNIHGIDGFTNIPCDRLEKDEVFLYAYVGDSLVGMFDVGSIMAAYLSEAKQPEYNKNGIERR